MKKDKSDTGKSGVRALQTEHQRRQEMAARSSISRFQNRSSDRK